MRIAILGAGMVGRALAGRLGEIGHDVHAGTRSTGTYADAAAVGELIINATPASPRSMRCTPPAWRTWPERC